MLFLEAFLLFFIIIFNNFKNAEMGKLLLFLLYWKNKEIEIFLFL